MVFTQTEARFYLESLLNFIPWQPDEVVIFGKRIVTSRKVAWFGDQDFAYTYSNSTRIALPWTETLLQIKSKVEKVSGCLFNSCLLNLYHEGNEGMGWHSDDEKTLEPHSAIASVSFGAARKFSFRHKKTRETLSLLLENGSLLVMKDETQTHWHHSLPKTNRKVGIRINLTFRRML